jgi:HK97 family phage major capsid protein
MDPELKALLESQSKAFEEVKKSNDLRLKELESKAKESGEVAEKLDKANKEVSRLGDEVKALMTARNRPQVEQKGYDGSARTESEVKLRKSFVDYCKKGDRAQIGEEELKAMISSDDPSGGYLVPQDLSGRIVQKVFESSAIRSLASVASTSSSALEGTYDDGEADAGWVGEQAARPETTSPQVGRWVIPAFEIYAKPKATQTMIDDSAVDLESWLANKVAAKFGRKSETAFVVGNGTSQPRGIMTYTEVLTGSGSRAAGGTIRTVKTGTNGDMTNADKLVSMIMAIKGVYRANGSWILSREGIEKARLLKQDSKYIWAPSVLSIDAQAKVGNGAGTLLGYPVVECNDLAAFATDAYIGAFGDFREAYQIVDRVGIRTLRDPYSAKPFVEFYSTARVGGAIINFEAIGYLKASA